MAPTNAIEEHVRATATRTKNRQDQVQIYCMVRLRIMIDELSKRAVESELISLLATCRKARLYNANLARELHEVIGALKDELDRRQDGPCANR